MITRKRLKEIKESIARQEQVVEAFGQDLLSVEEEKELYNEVIRLNKVIKDFDNWLDDQIDFFMDTESQDYLCAVYSMVYCKLREFKENNEE